MNVSDTDKLSITEDYEDKFLKVKSPSTLSKFSNIPELLPIISSLTRNIPSNSGLGILKGSKVNIRRNQGYRTNSSKPHFNTHMPQTDLQGILNGN